MFFDLRLWHTTLTVPTLDHRDLFRLNHYRLWGLDLWLRRRRWRHKNFYRAQSLNNCVLPQNIKVMIVIMENGVSESTISFERINFLFGTNVLSMRQSPSLCSLVVRLFHPFLFALPFWFDHDRKDGSGS